MRADHLLLSSGRPATAATAGRVVDPGHGSDGTRDGVRLDVRAPSTLVLAESYDRGWRAECDGKDLGAPRPVDGFANGWDVARGCRSASFTFAPQDLAWIAYAVSTLLALLLFAIAFVGWRRSRGVEPEESSMLAEPPADPLLRVGWGRALAIGIAAAAIGAFLFALRAGIVIGPVTVIALRVGISRSRLLTAAMAGLAAIPVVYLAFPAEDLGGFSFGYALDELGAHWIAVGVVICVGVASALAARAVRE
jgi:hypothetical protein